MLHFLRIILLYMHVWSQKKTMARRQDRSKVHVQCTRLSMYGCFDLSAEHAHHISLRFPILASYITNFRGSWLDMSLEFSVK